MRALFKYVIKSKLFSKCEYITHSLSISLMTYFRSMQLCHTRSICLTWREIIAAKFHLPSCSFSNIFPYFDTHGIWNPCMQISKKSSVLYSLPEWGIKTIPQGLIFKKKLIYTVHDEKYWNRSSGVRPKGVKCKWNAKQPEVDWACNETLAGLK